MNFRDVIIEAMSAEQARAVVGDFVRDEYASVENAPELHQGTVVNINDKRILVSGDGLQNVHRVLPLDVNGCSDINTGDAVLYGSRGRVNHRVISINCLVMPVQDIVSGHLISRPRTWEAYRATTSLYPDPLYP